jgi:CO/xanthine dehydrogenase FAD-binding subunit
LVEHSAIAENFPLLATACHTIGSHQIRNRATIGGNIVNAAPCADSVPPLIIYDAEVELRMASSSLSEGANEGVITRRMPLCEFITGGYRTELQTGELLTKVILPKLHANAVSGSSSFIQKYSQLGRRNALNITRLSLSCLMGFDENNHVSTCRLVDGALFSKPQRLTAIEDELLGYPLDQERLLRAETILMDAIDTAIGGRWSAKYKQPVFTNMFRDLMNDIRAEHAEGVA